MPEPRPDQAQVDQAIDWLVRRRFAQPGAQTEQQFQRWLQQHPHNALAWQRVEAMSDEFAGLPRDLSRRTLDSSQRPRIGRRDGLKLLGLFAVVGSLGWGTREQVGLPALPALLADSHTAPGEQRLLTTDDGSRIRLNTDSAIDLHFDQRQRLLTLVRGEVAIEAGNDSRPLLVQTRNGFLGASDARLLVRERAEGTLLAVRQGDVSLYPGAALGSSPLHIARAGESLLFTAQGQLLAPHLHGDPWAWSEGVLSVQRMPLGEFLEELARYRRGLTRCAKAVAGLEVSGTFQLADTDRILALIAEALPIRVQYQTRYWVNVSPA